MKLIRNPWVLSGTVVLGVVVAACSSKTTDNGTGVGGVTNGGGAANGNGGGGGVSNGAGGKTSAAATTGGRVATGGSSAADYCNGLFTGKTCSQTNVQANVKVVNMLIVLDESGSMNDPAVAGGASKWTIMKQALNTALTKPEIENNINFGLLLFPYLEGGIPPNSTSQADNCAVPDNVSLAVNVSITPGATGLQNVLDKIDNQSPGGGTPTTRALQQAYAYFTTGDGKTLQGSKWVLLATDGGPNCNSGLNCTAATCTQNLDQKCAANINCCDPPNGFVCLDDAATTSEIQLLAQAGIDTFVIGIPGSEAYATSLDNFANAGKVPNTSGLNGETYYAISATSAQQDLINAFSTITTQLVKSCDIPLATTPTVGPDQISVTIDCVSQPSVAVGSPVDGGADGYYIDSQNPAHLQIVGAPCANLKANGATHVDVIAGCPHIN